MRSFLNILLYSLIIVILSSPSIKPLFIPGFFPMHDDTQPARVYEMAKALSYGQFPVRLVGDLGYGASYPLFNFYAPLPYYIGGVFNLLGFSAISSTKIMFAIGILLSGFTMFFLVRVITGNIAGIVSSVLYMYAPYHAVNIYVRGAVGEYYAYSFLPLVLLGMLLIFKSSQNSRSHLKKGILVGSLGYTGVLLSHNILGLITTYFIAFFLLIYLLFILINKKEKTTLYFLFFTFLLGLGLSSFFILPAFSESKYTNVSSLITGGSDYHHNFIFLDQLWNSPWGFGGSAGRNSGMSFKVGKLHLLFGLISVVLFFFLLRRKKITKLFTNLFIFLVSFFLISIFFMISQSQFLWEAIPGFAFIQYPWRFLNFTILDLAVLSSVIFLLFKAKRNIILAAVLIFLTLFFNLKYFTPQTILPLKDEDYISISNLNFKISKISDEYLPKNFVRPKSLVEALNRPLTQDSDVNVQKVIKNTPTEKSYLVDSKKYGPIVTNIAYFPGWHAYSNNLEINIKDINGRVSIYSYKAQYYLTFKFKNTEVRTIANTISLLSLILLVYVSSYADKHILWIRKKSQLKS